MDQLAAVNLNQLVALDALLVEGSVSRAAQRVGVTQSAMSHTLRQLRELFDDPLLVRAGRRMVRTPRADALAPGLRGALASLEAVLVHQGHFEPARFAGRLTLATQDGVTVALSPALFQHFRAQAPQAALSIVRPPNDLVQALEDGRVDVATAPPIDVPAGLRRSDLAEAANTWAVICCEDHSVTELDLDAFCALPHCMMSLSGHGPSFVDHALTRLGRRRRVAVRLPYLLALPHALRGTDMISVVVKPAADHFVANWPVRKLTIPLELPTLPMTLLWHARYEAAPEHRWFRNLVADVARSAPVRSSFMDRRT